jgi:hypothetical protein
MLALLKSSPAAWAGWSELWTDFKDVATSHAEPTRVRRSSIARIAFMLHSAAKQYLPVKGGDYKHAAQASGLPTHLLAPRARIRPVKCFTTLPVAGSCFASRPAAK